MQDFSPWQTPKAIQSALACRRIAVVGMSSNELRDSHLVGSYMHGNGYTVIPVNPNETEILGLTCYPTLSAIPEPVDLVDVFRNSSAVPEIAQETIAIKANYLWLQFNVISPEGVAIAEAGNVSCIVDLCIKIEHARYQGHTH